MINDKGFGRLEEYDIWIQLLYFICGFKVWLEREIIVMLALITLGPQCASKLLFFNALELYIVVPLVLNLQI